MGRTIEHLALHGRLKKVNIEKWQAASDEEDHVRVRPYRRA